MKLLDPKTIKEEKRAGEVELANRVRKLKEEEGASVARLNEALALEAEEKARIKEDLWLVKKEAELAVRKSVLIQEVKALEERKADLLKPVHEIMKEAENRLVEAKRQATEVARRLEDLVSARERLSEGLEALADREVEDAERSQQLNKREAATQAAEEEIKRSTETLGKKWVDFHNEVYSTQEGLRLKEKEIEDARIVNKIYAETLTKFEKELRNLERDVKDRQATLLKHIERLGLKI